MNENLRPCPFCGATDVEPWIDDYSINAVFCHHCGATGPQGEYRAQAIKKWNRRTKDAETIVDDPM